MQTPGTNAARTAGSAATAAGTGHPARGHHPPWGPGDRETLGPKARELLRTGQQPGITNQTQEGRGSSAACSEMDEFQAQIKQTTRGAKKLR